VVSCTKHSLSLSLSLSLFFIRLSSFLVALMLFSPSRARYLLAIGGTRRAEQRIFAKSPLREPRSRGGATREMGQSRRGGQAFFGNARGGAAAKSNLFVERSTSGPGTGICARIVVSRHFIIIALESGRRGIPVSPEYRETRGICGSDEYGGSRGPRRHCAQQRHTKMTDDRDNKRSENKSGVARARAYVVYCFSVGLFAISDRNAPRNES